MTERLSQLLHDEATDLDLPVPHADQILSDGRRLRRRRRVAAGLAAAAAVTVVGGVGLATLQLGGAGDRALPGPAGATVSSVPAFGVGSDVHLGDEVATVPDTVHSLHYTSEGVLVRSNPHDGASDGSGPESLSLVRYDGTTVDLGTVPEGVGPATDPDRDVYVLAEARGDGFVAVVRDVATGEPVDEVPLPDLLPSYWDVPPLSLDGETLYVGYRTQTVAVDLATGEHSVVDGLEGGMPEVAGGRSVASGGGDLAVVDVASGETLLSVEVGRDSYAYGTLSPDGRFLRVVQEETFDEDGNYVEADLSVYDVASGAERQFPGAFGWGWTADSGLFKVEKGTLTTCDAATGECTEEPAPAIGRNAELRLGGITYES